MKIATCCYCGTRAALVLDKARHELSCSGCGAPLHNMKSMPKPAAQPVKSAPVSRPAAQKIYKQRDTPPRYARKKTKKYDRKPKGRWAREILEEIWDVVEDIFD